MASQYDPVQSAFEKSVRNFKADLKDDKLYNEILQTTTIDQVYDLTDKLQEEQAKNGHLRHLSKIEPFLESLRSYTGVIDTFVQAKPDILALIWGPIKLLIQWASTLKKSLDELLKTIGEIGDLLPEFEEFMRLFGHNNQIKDVLALFFQDILDIYVVALKFFSLSRLKFIFESMWPKQRDKIRFIMSHIERHTLLMRNEVRLEHIREEHKARLDAQEHYERTERSHRKQEYNAIKEAVSPETYEGDLNRIRGRICEGTGRWLLRDVAFTKWLKGSEKPAKPMWLQGIPGAGKTYLASTVVDHALTQGPTLFVFLSYNFGSSISALSIINSLIFQLTSDNDDLQAILCQSVAKEPKRELKVAVELLTTLLNVAGPVFIIIDGIDEIDEFERKRLLSRLLELSNSCEEAKILVSSRVEDDIYSILRDKTIEIRVDNRNAGSIQAFVSRRAQAWFLSQDFLPEARDEIEGLLAPLSSKAKGMFLYAKVVLSSIEHLDDMIEIRNELQVLPENLDDAYERIFNRINNLKPLALRNKARKLLGWIGSSLTPLTIQEIEQALTIRMDDADGDGRVIARLNPVQICGPILEVVDDYVQFVHFTVKEYLFSPHVTAFIDLTDSALSLATCCIQYLCQRHHDEDLSDDEFSANLLLGIYRLHEYSTTMWLRLVEQHNRLAKARTPPTDLVCLLRVLIEKRSSDEFSGGTTALLERNLGQDLVKTDDTEVLDLLCNVADFQKKCSEGEYDKRQDISWIHLDPLTITRTSIRLYHEFDKLLCGSGEHHKENCHCNTVHKSFGQRPFKCSFLGCSFSRYGFLTKSARNSHQKHHELPWKCSRSDCPYSQGFLSRRMRDQHWEQCHQEEQNMNPLPQTPDEDELQPLLFDLVIADKIEHVKTLLPQYAKYDISLRMALIAFATRSGSVAMVELFVPQIVELYNTEVYDDRRFLIQLHVAAIEGNNIKSFLFILKLFQFEYYANILPNILKSKCEEFLLDWKAHVDAEFKCWQNKVISSSVPFGERYTRPEILKVAKGDLDNAAIILSIWKEINLPGSLSKLYLGVALANVAMTCFSVNLAQYLLDAGAEVDHRRSPVYFTPLHHAVKSDTTEAAELAQYLLSKGADPTNHATSGPSNRKKIRRIRDEVGAKGISKWTGLSWDDLVEKIQAQRREAEIPENQYAKRVS